MRALGIIFAVISTLSGIPQGNAPVDFYPNSAMVSEVNYAADEVVVQDFLGNRWAFKGADDWEPGDLCSMIMCDNGTEEVYDDIIVDYRYSGWVY